MAKLPPDYQPLANARLAMATRAADAVTVLRGVAPAKLDAPAIQLERAQWMRRTGSLDDARALLAKPVANPNDAWWNERNQVARDLLAAGRAADAYAIVVPHGLTRASPSPRPSSWPAGSRCATSRRRPRRKSISRRCTTA